MAGDIQKSANGAIVDSDGRRIDIEVSMDCLDVTGTSDTIAASDNGRTLRYTDAGLVTVTLPVGIPVNTVVELLFWGAAGGLIQGDGSSTVQLAGNISQYRTCSALVVATDTWSVVGPVG